jgi:hypothetical protein
MILFSVIRSFIFQQYPFIVMIYDLYKSKIEVDFSGSNFLNWEPGWTMFHFPPGAPSGFQVTQIMFFFFRRLRVTASKKDGNLPWTEEWRNRSGTRNAIAPILWHEPSKLHKARNIMGRPLQLAASGIWPVPKSPSPSLFTTVDGIAGRARGEQAEPSALPLR